MNSRSEEASPISEAIMDRMIHNILIDGKISMRERHGLRNQEVRCGSRAGIPTLLLIRTQPRIDKPTSY